jgi:hypothetical protein
MCASCHPAYLRIILGRPFVLADLRRATVLPERLD